VPGMTSGVNTNDPVLEAAFRAALLHQGFIVLAIALALLLAYGLLRRRPAAAGLLASGRAGDQAATAEPSARRFLRMSFGLLWIIDGILQAQPEMAAGLPSQVAAPAAGASPGWVQAVVNAGGTVWSYHPVQAAAAATWIQLGLGVWLLTAPRGWSLRLAALGTVGWGLVVWMFGEAFGAIFAPGLSWLSGAPGAVVLYIVAGSLLALPTRAWASPRLGRLLLSGIGVCWLGMAVLQAWPGRGYWQDGMDGTLSSMISNMAGLTQPDWQARMINGVALFAQYNAIGVNLVAVLGLALAGGGLLAGAGMPAPRELLRLGHDGRHWGPPRPRVLQATLLGATAFCLVVWVTVQDFGFPGGLGTDPNSMIPWVLLLWTGYRAMASPYPGLLPDTERLRTTRQPGSQAAQLAGALRAGMTRARTAPAGTVQAAWRAVASASARAVSSGRAVMAVGAFGVVIVGVVPLAAAAASPQADPLIAQAIAGQSMPADRPAPDFHLVSQSGQPVSLATLRGTVTLLTFLDPRCVAACPVAIELKEAGTLLGGADGQVRLVAIAASQLHYSMADVQALNRIDGLAGVPNWLFLTGSAAELQAVWGKYGIFVSHMAPGSSSVMTDLVFVIGANGRIREEIRDNPGPGTISTRSSFATLLSGAARQALAVG
jgi:cytochrome oxidase Cu insertion factor (SCO1/SenC/PrrC family)